MFGRWVSARFVCEVGGGIGEGGREEEMWWLFLYVACIVRV